ncbi:NUAK family SNF1-like kinase 1 [Trichonephila inaurata madagascariensis]|uniref:NUAK family SNF1-like kinase 1 n=1 Tax=Trichonephila inaurata madagascariensis TaxID=2747483 RepID=A0A8X6KJJ1_9ARAC|nr:NUAK family SNF1-like kinase 1 [Trichonephila inaurata madagascariensis]
MLLTSIEITSTAVCVLPSPLPTTSEEEAKKKAPPQICWVLPDLLPLFAPGFIYLGVGEPKSVDDCVSAVLPIRFGLLNCQGLSGDISLCLRVPFLLKTGVVISRYILQIWDDEVSGIGKNPARIFSAVLFLCKVAVKTIKKNKIENDQDLIRIRREIQIMSSIQHPHITHIYEVFENKDKIVLVMQFASGGELYDYLSEKKVLSDLEARRIFRQIAAAVYYCHKNKICHRDLKLENILLDEKGNAKIADFGLSNVFDEKHLLNTYCGSPLYASPEIVKGVPYYGPEVDCWSMGVLLYTLVYGAMPFDGSNFKKLVTQISEGDYFEPKNKSNASDLIRKLLTVNPSKRATIVDICVDYWVNLGYEHSLLQVAEDMANLTPVRLDLLLALAPDATIPQEEAEDQPMEDLMSL